MDEQVKKIKIEKGATNNDGEESQKKKKKKLHPEGSSSTIDTSRTDIINLEGVTVKKEDTSFEKRKRKGKNKTETV